MILRLGYDLSVINFLRITEKVDGAIAVLSIVVGWARCPSFPENFQ
ncbi:hypothetical protein [Scytonema hofmannii]|nr:hypothetical protein [Scytonema hofmannii]